MVTTGNQNVNMSPGNTERSLVSHLNHTILNCIRDQNDDCTEFVINV